MAPKKRTSVDATTVALDRADLRRRIIKEHRLREEVTRQGKLRRKSPDVWRWQEAIRIEGNRSNAELNRKLRSRVPAVARPRP